MENTEESEFICLNLKIPCLFIRIKNQEKQAEAIETAKKFKRYFQIVKIVRKNEFSKFIYNFVGGYEIMIFDVKNKI